jgi:hypothetical protein
MEKKNEQSLIKHKKNREETWTKNRWRQGWMYLCSYTNVCTKAEEEPKIFSRWRYEKTKTLASCRYTTQHAIDIFLPRFFSTWSNRKKLSDISFYVHMKHHLFVLLAKRTTSDLLK